MIDFSSHRFLKNNFQDVSRSKFLFYKTHKLQKYKIKFTRILLLTYQKIKISLKIGQFRKKQSEQNLKNVPLKIKINNSKILIISI